MKPCPKIVMELSIFADMEPIIVESTDGKDKKQGHSEKINKG
jgi:hypothetical protein